MQVSSQALGVVVLGAVLVLVGVFLPAINCDSKGYYTCTQDSTALFDSDYFDDPYEFSDGITNNFFPINYLVIAGVAIVAVVREKGLLSSGITLLGLVTYQCFTIWDQIDRTESVDLSFGIGWIPLFLGALLIVYGGLQLRNQPRHWQGPPGYGAGQPYQQPPDQPGF